MRERLIHADDTTRTLLLMLAAFVPLVLLFVWPGNFNGWTLVVGFGIAVLLAVTGSRIAPEARPRTRLRWGILAALPILLWGVFLVAYAFQA